MIFTNHHHRAKKNAFGYVKCCFIKLVAIDKIALIDNDFYKLSSSGKKMHLDMLNDVL